MSQKEKPELKENEPSKTIDEEVKKFLKGKKEIKATDTMTKEEVVKVVNKLKEERALEFTGLDGIRYLISLKQKLFCESYLKLHGNGTQAAVDAGYNVTNSKGVVNYNLAHVIASENLRKPTIIAYINLKMKEYGFEDDNVKKQHLFLINQFDDMAAKAKGIDMFYKVKGEYAADKSDKSLNTKLEEALDRLAGKLP